MDADLAKVVRASAYLIAGSVIVTGGMLSAAISSTVAPGGMAGVIGSLVGMVPLGMYWFSRGIRDMPFLR